MKNVVIEASMDVVVQVGSGHEPIARQHHVCVQCQERRSLFRYRGAVKADRDHTLCFQCYRALRDTMRAIGMAHRTCGAA